MPGISLVTKGFLCPPAEVSVTTYSGSGGAGLRKEEELPKPLIKVNNVKIGKGKKILSKENVKVTSVKLIID